MCYRQLLLQKWMEFRENMSEYDVIIISTHWGRDKINTIWKVRFQIYFLLYYCMLKQNLFKFVSNFAIYNLPDNGLAPSMSWDIFWKKKWWFILLSHIDVCVTRSRIFQETTSQVPTLRTTSGDISSLFLTRRNWISVFAMSITSREQAVSIEFRFLFH